MNDPHHPLTPEVQQQICGFIRPRKGNSPRLASRRAESQPESVPEAVVNPHPTDDVPATNPQPTGSETPPATPFGEVEFKCFPGKMTWNPFAGFEKCARIHLDSG